MVTTSNNNPNDIFWLARYAHNKTAPLFAKAKAIEPTVCSAIEMFFAEPGAQYHGDNAIEVKAWWNRDGMFQMSNRLKSQADVDRFAAKLEGDVAVLAIPALVEA